MVVNVVNDHCSITRIGFFVMRKRILGSIGEGTVLAKSVGSSPMLIIHLPAQFFNKELNH